MTKTFQWRKMYVFHSYFKAWRRVLYVDAQMKILKPLDPLWELDTKGSLVAHSDSFPQHEWTLSMQFDRIASPDIYQELAGLVNRRKAERAICEGKAA